MTTVAKVQTEQMSEFEQLQFAADTDEFFDIFFDKLEKGIISFEQAEGFFERLGCKLEPDPIE